MFVTVNNQNNFEIPIAFPNNLDIVIPISRPARPAKWGLEMTNRYQCIGDDLRGYFVEPKYPDGRMWIVPGTYAEDPTNTEAAEKAAAYRALWRVEQ